jgi:kumamolisin
MFASGKLVRVALSIAVTLMAATGAHVAPAVSVSQPMVTTLSGHVLPALDRATAASSSDNAPLTITFVLNRDDEAGFQRYLHDVYDPSSPNFRQFLDAAQIAQQFGPSPESYARLTDFATSQHLSIATTSTNRMTLTTTGTRANVESAFAVHIGDYRLGERTFFANRDAPALPADIAPHVNAVLGLSDLAQAAHAQGLTQGQKASPKDPSLAYTCQISAQLDDVETGIQAAEKFFGRSLPGGANLSVATTILHYQCAADELDLITSYYANLVGSRPSGSMPMTTAAQPSGGGQIIALAEFDSYQTYDVTAFLNLIGYPERFAQLSNVTLGAGPNFTTQGESEVLLDIDTVMSLAPGATFRTYSAGFKGQGSFQTLFNAMIGGNVDVISNSWAYCEDQTTLADVQSLETVLQTAAAAGITVLTGAGDSGSTCLDGAANTIAVPASSPSITAVGGTSATPGIDGTYGSETWWDGTQQTPPSGQGGFGTSRFFARPAYQNGLNAQANRSIPDVSAPADPAQGVLICQTDAGGCPTDTWFGGTSIAAPIWAASMAVLNQRAGHNFGFLNSQIYPFANGTAFHSGASMGSDFAHVGLGSPNFSELKRRLLNGSLGSASVANSAVVAFPPLTYADGASQVGVSVIAMDANFNAVPNQSVTLSANAGAHATITAVNATSNANNGAARFTVTDNTAETITLTAKFGATALTSTAQIKFVGAPAASGGIVASPTTQTADGASTSTITVSLKDAQNRPAAGKLVQLAQGANSVILGANPLTTDVNGEAQFDVTDQVQETAVYTAIDTTDYDVPVPGSASVAFTNAAANACGLDTAPVAGPGYAISTYASGFPVRSGVTFGNITLNGCVGVTGIAFDSAQTLYAADYVTGDVYKFPVGGGIAGAGNKLTATAIGTSLGSLATGADGTLYATRVATSMSATTGVVLKIDKSTGASSTVASNLLCPSDIRTDPISGDLFVADFCFGNAEQSDAIVRIANPNTASPTVSTYANTGTSPTGSLSFAPDGTLYAVYGYPSFPGLFAGIVSIGRTNGTQPAPVQAIGAQSTFSALALGNNPAGGAQTLIVSSATLGGYAHSVAAIDLTVTPPVFSGTTLVQNDIGSTKILGPDQCLYFANGNAVYKITNDDGSCPLTGLAPNPSLVLTPESNPAVAVQGTPLRFDVAFPHNPDLPFGTVISYEIDGANASIGATVSAFGSVSFAYTGVYGGTDKVSASATIGGVDIASNVVTVNWSAGKHTTFLDLNGTVASGTWGITQPVSAVLFDQSASPFAPIAGATVAFTLSDQTCSAITDANGRAACNLPVSALGQCTVTATYGGSGTFLAAAASQLFQVSANDVLFANGFEAPEGAGCVRY